MATMNSGLGGPAGYGENVFSTTTKTAGNNDDGSVFVDITSVFGGEGVDYYGSTYTGLYINSNGNISFGAANTAYAPNLAGTTTDVIAPFWSDVNINSGGEIYWDMDTVNGVMTITWLNVAPYSGTGTNSFQVVLTDTGTGNFSIEYIYENVTWTNGGSGTAQTGWTDGGANDVTLPGSGNGTILANYETYDFGTGDPAGTTGVFMVNGVPSATDGLVEGTAGDDLLDFSYLGDPDGDVIGTGGDNIFGYAGNDTIDAGAGDDGIFGGDGDDTILWDLGDGNDTIDGGGAAETAGDTLDITATGTATGTTLTGDGTGSTTIGATTLDFTDIENFVFDAGTADTFDGTADTVGLNIDTGAGDDWIAGGTGADTISAGDGADTIYGDGFVAATTEDLNWTLQGGNNTNIAGGFTQNTGTMNVSVSRLVTGDNNPTLLVSTNTQYVDTGAGETFATNSSARLFGDGDAATEDVTIDFAAAAGSGMTDEVENVSFRINDIDHVAGTLRDQVTITAIDANGDPVAVTLTAAGNEVITGNTATAGLSNTNESESQPDGSVLVEIAGPVSSITISYSNLDVATHAVFVTDVAFTTIPDESLGAADTIDGGAGDDVVYGQTGDDTIDGGDGDDVIYGDDAPATVGPNLIVNGSFEDTTGMSLDANGYHGAGSAPGWTEVNGAQVDFHDNARYGVVPTDGGNWLDMAGSGTTTTVSQTVAGVTAGDDYLLTFDVADFSSGDDGTADDNTVTVYWGGQVVAVIDPADDSTFQSYEITVTGGAGDGSNTLVFEGNGANTFEGASVDNVQMYALQATGTGGNDTIDGGAGADTIYGGAGDDTILASGEPSPNPDAWISEIDYIGGGESSGEYIEVTALAGTDLSAWTIGFYTVPPTYVAGDSPTLSVGTPSSFFPSTPEITLQDILDATGGVMPTPGSPVSVPTGIAGGVDLTVYVHPDNPDYLVFQLPAMMASPVAVGANNTEAIALTNTSTGTVVQAYDIGQNNGFGPLSGGAANGAMPVTTNTATSGQNLQIDSNLTITSGAETLGDSTMTPYADDDGADVIFGGSGNDTIELGAGDTASGGDGDDIFILDPNTALGGAGAGATITIIGDEASETGGDTLDFSGLIDWGTITYTDAETGTATLADGTTVAFSNIENVIICFTEGTMIATPNGERRIETLRPGDFVLTRDHGPQPLRWIGASEVQGTGLLAPIEFARGAFGNDRPLLVSPQHRMLYEGGLATLYFETREVMVPAKHLVNGTTIREVERGRLRYIHLLFDRHEVVWANGAASESFHPAAEGLEAIDDPTREELFRVFPELRSNPGGYGQTARTVLKSFEARLLT